MKDREIDNTQYETHRCPVCNGFGTLKYGTIKCRACNGEGFITLDKLTGRKVLSIEEEIKGSEKIYGK